MEMWHNGEQASSATVAMGATNLRATAQRAQVSSHLPNLPSLTHSLPSLSPHRTKTLCLCKNFNVVPL